MAGWNFYVPTVTQAMRGRNVLNAAGVHAFVSRNPDPTTGAGCGYRITVQGDFVAAERILRQKGIAITRKDGGR